MAQVRLPVLANSLIKPHIAQTQDGAQLVLEKARNHRLGSSARLVMVDEKMKDSVRRLMEKK